MTDGVVEEAVRVSGLAKSFPVERGWKSLLQDPFRKETTTALRGVSLTVERGEFFGLLGANGAGKSTLFKILTTLVTPDAGRAWVHGHEVSEEPERAKELLGPVLATERSLYWRLNPVENLELFGALLGMDGKEATRRSNELVELVGLGSAREKMVGTYSSGMKQRLLLGRALLGRPRVLLLDEPTRSLDPVAAERFRAFLKEEVGGDGERTVIVATHDPAEALEFCGRVGLLHEGRLLAEDSPRALRARYGEPRYSASVKGWTPQAREALRDTGTVSSMHSGPGEEPGWTEVILEIPGGDDTASGVLALLVSHGVRVARFEKIELNLAELIQRIVEDDGIRSGDSNASVEVGSRWSRRGPEDTDAPAPVTAPLASTYPKDTKDTKDPEAAAAAAGATESEGFNG